jgi:ribosomal protein S18 acetylase RimI-like enzyme
MNIDLIENPPQKLVDLLDNKIVEFNRQNREINNRHPIAVTVKNSQGELVAGASGQTFGNWLHLSVLWVSEDLRGQNYGSKLLNKIEQSSKDRGCNQCLLDTLNFQAMPFYKKHGYEITWTQKNYPLTGCKYFMIKTL